MKTTEEQVTDLIQLAEDNKLEGEFFNLDIDAYFKGPGFSRSDLTTILNQSLAHLVYKKEHPQQSTKAMLFGTAFHDMITGDEYFLSRNFCKDEIPEIETPKFGRTKAEIEKKEKWLEGTYQPWQRETLEPWIDSISTKRGWDKSEWANLIGMLAATKSHEVLQNLMEDCEIETSYFWRDPGSDLLLKARPDLVNKRKRVLLDFKTTMDASFVQFQRSIANFQYHVQGAFYLDGVNRVLDGDFDQFILVAVEKNPPYEIALYSLDAASLEVGRETYKRAIKKLKSNEHGYPRDIQAINLPAWAFHLED